MRLSLELDYSSVTQPRFATATVPLSAFRQHDKDVLLKLYATSLMDPKSFEAFAKRVVGAGYDDGPVLIWLTTLTKGSAHHESKPSIERVLSQY